MSMLWNWFANFFFPLLRNLFLETWKFFSELFGSWWKIFKLQWGILIGLLAMTVWALGRIVTLLNQLDLSTMPKPTIGMLQYYAFINRFIPLSEACAGAIVCFQVWLVVTLIRWIKSFIPTVSN